MTCQKAEDVEVMQEICDSVVAEEAKGHLFGC